MTRLQMWRLMMWFLWFDWLKSFAKKVYGDIMLAINVLLYFLVKRCLWRISQIDDFS